MFFGGSYIIYLFVMFVLKIYMALYCFRSFCFLPQSISCIDELVWETFSSAYFAAPKEKTGDPLEVWLEPKRGDAVFDPRKDTLIPLAMGFELKVGVGRLFSPPPNKGPGDAVAVFVPKMGDPFCPSPAKNDVLPLVVAPLLPSPNTFELLLPKQNSGVGLRFCPNIKGVLESGTFMPSSPQPLAPKGDDGSVDWKMGEQALGVDTPVFTAFPEKSKPVPLPQGGLLFVSCPVNPKARGAGPAAGTLV